MKDKRMSREEYIKECTGQEMPKTEEQIKKEKEQKDKKICCIVGTAGSRHLAPYDNPNAEIWGVAHCLLLNDIPRMDKVFEIHLPYVYEKEISPFSRKPIIYHANKEDACNWRPKEDMSVIVSKKNPKLNKQEIFPRKELKEKYDWMFPPHDKFYCTNSIAWMLIYAIDMNRFDEIHLYGVHLETDSEWQYERPCNELWIGFFMGRMYERGIKTPVVYLPPMSDVLKAYNEYGFEEMEVQREQYKERATFFEKQLRDVQFHRNNLAMEKNRLIKELQMPIKDKIELIVNQRDTIKKELDIIAQKTPEEYKQKVEETINKRIDAIDKDLIELDKKICTVQGAWEQTRYTLKQFNA